MKYLLLALAFISPTIAYADMTLDPHQGYTRDGYLTDVRAVLEVDDNGYLQLASPDGILSECQITTASTWYLGAGGGWVGDFDFSKKGAWIVSEYSDNGCTSLVDREIFVLGNQSPLFDGGTVFNVVGSVGIASSPVFQGVNPYTIIVMGIIAAFFIGMRLISIVKHGVGQNNRYNSGSDTDQLRRKSGRNETQEEINRQFPLM